MTVGERIKKMRESLQISQVDFADKLGVSKQTLYKYENNIITNIPSDKIENIAAISGVSPAYIMGWTECVNMPVSLQIDSIHPISKISLPVLGKIACGEPIFANQEKEVFIKANSDIHADFCLIASGDSMINARIHDGDIVFIRKQDMVENGEIAAVIIDDEATLKRLYYYKEQSLLVLHPENPSFKDQTYSGEDLNHVRILGKAVAFQSEVF